MSQETKDVLVKEITEGKEARQMVPEMKKLALVELSEILSSLDDQVVIDLMPEFSTEQQGLILSEFDVKKQLSLFQKSDARWFAGGFQHMYSESRADLFQHMTQQEQASLLPFLPKKIRTDVIRLSAYPPETAGGIMSTDFATVWEDMTCQQAIAKVRMDAPSKKMIYYVYVVDENMCLAGFITLKDLILIEPDTKVKDALHKEYIFAHVDDDRENVAAKIEKYDLVAIPVLNNQGQLVGIVTHDEAIEVIRAEHTEDFEKFMGIMPDKEEVFYLQTSSWSHFKKRVIWVVSLAIIGIISGMIIHSFESTLDKLLILALYMPMVADTGGNAGSQAATVVVRALALGQVSVRNWWRIIWKEAQISLLLAICLGVLAFGKVLFLSWEADIPEVYNLFQIASVISLALSLQVITATIIGASLPLIVRRFKGDPAVAASPAITTVVDITGLLIYFGTAVAFLSL
ncbi:magnesium transporter [Cytophagaceae bacterium ABcell3]|nr:magnesium transporter [Cytophagaceae bacterium ABcell3]